MGCIKDQDTERENDDFGIGQLALKVEDTGASRMFPSQPLTERPNECPPRDGLVEMAQVGTERTLIVAIELVRGCLEIDLHGWIGIIFVNWS